MDASNSKRQKSQRSRVTLKKNTNIRNIKTVVQSTTSIDEKFDILIDKMDEKFDILVDKIDKLDEKFDNKFDTLESQLKDI